MDAFDAYPRTAREVPGFPGLYEIEDAPLPSGPYK